MTYPQGRPGQTTFVITRSNPTAPGTYTLSGFAALEAGASSIGLRMGYGGKNCSGTADKTTKKWAISCASGAVFAGTFVEGSNNLYEGIGKMSTTDQTVDFNIQKPIELPKAPNKS